MQDKHDITKLEARINDAHQLLTKLGEGRELEELIKVVRRPGWTTPAEFLFAMGLIESIVAEAKTLTSLKQALVAGSHAVGKEVAIA